MNILDRIFKKENKCEDLEKENVELKAKLVEKQEQINKTNAYYKKKLREQTSKKS